MGPVSNEGHPQRDGKLEDQEQGLSFPHLPALPGRPWGPGLHPWMSLRQTHSMEHLVFPCVVSSGQQVWGRLKERKLCPRHQRLGDHSPWQLKDEARGHILFKPHWRPLLPRFLQPPQCGSDCCFFQEQGLYLTLAEVGGGHFLLVVI